jgi:hypothetical protein
MVSCVQPEPTYCYLGVHEAAFKTDDGARICCLYI